MDRYLVDVMCRPGDVRRNVTNTGNKIRSNVLFSV